MTIGFYENVGESLPIVTRDQPVAPRVGQKVMVHDQLRTVMRVEERPGASLVVLEPKQ